MFHRHDFLIQLKLCSETPWDYEQEFLANFWPWEPLSAELLEFYIAEDTCKVVVMMSSGKTATTTINTEEYLDWMLDILGISA